MSAMRFTHASFPLLLLTFAALLARPACAQVERSGGGVNAQLYQDYQQALTERDRLRAENAKLKSDLGDANKRLAVLKQQLAAAQAGATSSQAAVTAAQASEATTARNLATLRSQALQLVARFRDTIGQLRTVELDRGQIQGDLTQSKAAFDRCAKANDQLYQVDDEVLNRYAHQGVFSHVASAEPFTRLERTRIDNLVLEYRQRAEELRVQPSGKGSTQEPTGSR